MTLPFRSSMDDDALDDALNAWVMGERHSERSEDSPRWNHRHSVRSEESPNDSLLGQLDLAVDALEFHRMAERALRTGQAATGPAAGTWNRVVRATAREEPKGRSDMITAALSTPAYGHALQPRESFGAVARRYVNLAATLLMVIAVAAGGWFAMSQMPDGGNGRFAALQGTPEATATPFVPGSTCETETLSVDRVMEIVKNPAYYMAYGPVASPTDRPLVESPPDAELWEVHTDLFLVDGTSVPTEKDFANASDFANRYLNCLMFGTQGQVWTFYSPAHLQRTILAEFQVFRSEQDIRDRVEERMSEPAYTGEAVWEYLPFINDIAEVAVNPDRKLALQQNSESSAYGYVVMMGVSLKDVDGRTIALTNGTGRNLIPNDPMITGTSDIQLYITVAKHRSGEGWVIIPWPSGAEFWSA